MWVFPTGAILEIKMTAAEITAAGGQVWAFLTPLILSPGMCSTYVNIHGMVSVNVNELSITNLLISHSNASTYQMIRQNETKKKTTDSIQFTLRTSLKMIQKSLRLEIILFHRTPNSHPSF